DHHRYALGDGRTGVAFVHRNVCVCARAVGRVGSEGPYTTGRGGAGPALLLLTPWWQQGDASVGRAFEEIGRPLMITLYGFGAGFGLPEISPFVTKTEVQLKMAGIAYRKEKAKPPASPKGQLPYIVDEAETIADSTFIRAHLEAKYGFDFDAPLSLQARAQAWAFERMIE